MAQPTWQIRNITCHRKSAAQTAQPNTGHCKWADHQYPTVSTIDNTLIQPRNLTQANEITLPQGTNSGHSFCVASERTVLNLNATLALKVNSDAMSIKIANTKYNNNEIRTYRSQNNPIGPRSSFELLELKTLHYGNNETPDSQSQSKDENFRPSILERRPVNNEITIEEMADEGMPSKKPRHEDSATDNAQTAQTGANSAELIVSIKNLPQEASLPSQGKKRPVSEVNNDPKQMNPLPQEQNDQIPIESDEFPSDDECMPNITPSELPLPEICPQVPSQRSIRWLQSAQKFAAPFGLTTADL